MNAVAYFRVSETSSDPVGNPGDLVVVGADGIPRLYVVREVELRRDHFARMIGDGTLERFIPRRVEDVASVRPRPTATAARCRHTAPRILELPRGGAK